MQSLRSLFVPTVVVTWMLHASGPIAQDPGTPDPAAQPERSQPRAAAPDRRGAAARQDPRRGGRGRFGGRRRGLTVIEAGTVHPVSGPPIQNGVVVIRGDRILAVGQQGDLQLPPNSTVLRYPDGHVYPGLVDAATDAFTDAGMKNDTRLNGGARLSDGLVWSGDRDDLLVQQGVTTAYVRVRSGAQVRGQGAVVRPRAGGFELWEGKEQAALQLRMSTGTGAQHPLQRQAQLEAAGKIFDGLEAFRDAQEKFDKDLEKYNEEFEKYLAHHRKKNGKDKPKAGSGEEAGDEPAASEPGEGDSATAPSSEGRRRGRRPGGRRQPPQGGGEGGGERTAEPVERALATLMALVGEPAEAAPAPQDPRRGRRGPPAQAQGKPAGGKPDDSADKSAKDKAAKKDDGPARPKYPKKPKEDLQKDALAQVVDGVMPLRIEAHRVEELRAALRLQRDNDVPLVVLEQAYGARAVADEIAEQGATVVLTDLLPYALAAPGDKRNPFAKFDVTALPRHLDAAGVPFAIASGSARLAGALPMMAAAAVGAGLSEAAALRALTLTPAEILGVAEDTGSLTRDKYADVLVTDGPLFASDSRVLLVVSKGRTEFERK